MRKNAGTRGGMVTEVIGEGLFNSVQPVNGERIPHPLNGIAQSIRTILDADCQISLSTSGRRVLRKTVEDNMSDG